MMPQTKLLIFSVSLVETELIQISTHNTNIIIKQNKCANHCQKTNIKKKKKTVKIKQFIFKYF